MFCNEQCLPPIRFNRVSWKCPFLLALPFGPLAVLSWHVCASHTWDIPQGTLLNDALSQSVVNCSGKKLAKPWAFNCLLETGSVPKETFGSPFNIPRRTAEQCVSKEPATTTERGHPWAVCLRRLEVKEEILPRHVAVRFLILKIFFLFKWVLNRLKCLKNELVILG